MKVKGELIEFNSRCVDVTVDGITRTAYQPFALDHSLGSLDLTLEYAKTTEIGLGCMYSVEVAYQTKKEELATTRYFIPFASHEEALKFTSVDMHGFEYTLKEGPRHLYMDVERENANETDATEIDILAAVFVVCKHVLPKIGFELDMEHVGILRATRKNKYSFHVIIRNVIFPSHEVEQLFKLLLRETLRSPPPELKPLVDSLVNYTKLNRKNRVMQTTTIDLVAMGRSRGQMRAPYQTKLGKPDSSLYILKGKKEDVWTYGFNGKTIPPHCKVERDQEVFYQMALKRNIRRKGKDRVQRSIDALLAQINNPIEMAKHLLLFDKTQTYPRLDTPEEILMSIPNSGKYYQTRELYMLLLKECKSLKGMKKLFAEWVGDDKWKADWDQCTVPNSYNPGQLIYTLHNHMVPHEDTGINLIKLVCDVPKLDLNKYTYIETTERYVSNIKVHDVPLSTAIQHQGALTGVRDPTDVDTWFIRSSVNTGKTTLLRNITCPDILLFSARRKHAQTLHEDLPHFNLYLNENKRKLEHTKFARLIISFESVWRLRNHLQYSTLILDEIQSLLSTLSGGSFPFLGSRIGSATFNKPSLTVWQDSIFSSVLSCVNAWRFLGHV